MDAHKTKILYAVGLGLFLSDLIPTPADAVYFNYQRNNKQKLNDGLITPKQYWVREGVGYYGFNAVWWASAIGTSFYFGKTFKQKRNIFLGVIASGVVLAVLHNNIKKDEAYYNQIEE